MADDPSYERTLGVLEGTMEGFRTSLNALSGEIRTAQSAQATRHDQVLDRIAECDRDVGEITTTVAVLAKLVDGHIDSTGSRFEESEKITVERFKSVWLWIAPIGGVGALLGAAALLLSFLSRE